MADGNGKNEELYTGDFDLPIDLSGASESFHTGGASLKPGLCTFKVAGYKFPKQGQITFVMEIQDGPEPGQDNKGARFERHFKPQDNQNAANYLKTFLVALAGKHALKPNGAPNFAAISGIVFKAHLVNKGERAIKRDGDYVLDEETGKPKMIPQIELNTRSIQVISRPAAGQPAAAPAASGPTGAGPAA